MKKKIQNCWKNIDKQQLFNLITGILGIYIIFFIAGIIHQAVINEQYINIKTEKSQKQDYPLGIVLVPFGVAWIIAGIYNTCVLQQRVNIPVKNSFLCGGAMAFTSVLSIVAIIFTSYPVVIMFESCNVLSVVLVAVFCSRVSQQRLKLDRKKIIIAGIISIGILLFQWFSPQTKNNNAQSNIIGFGALMIWIIVEGFFPDLQAQIKSKYKPQPTEMMAQINKWGTIFLLICMLIGWRIWGFIQFLMYHPIFTIQIFIMSIISAFGQFFVYRMIKQFKQHVLPFTITTRKIFSVVISIIFYHHKTNIIQIFGIFLVFTTVAYDFITQISKKPKKQTMSQEYFEEQFGKDENLNDIRQTQEQKQERGQKQQSKQQ